jgi:hypothetical protein
MIWIPPVLKGVETLVGIQRPDYQSLKKRRMDIMRQIKIAFIACLFLCLIASNAQSNGCYSGCYYSGGYWALQLLFLGVPVIAYTLSGGYSGTSVYVQPSYFYYESPLSSYQRTYYRTRTIEVEQPPISTSQALQRTVDDPDYRYYCRSPRGYYPDVMACPLGWKKVMPAYNPIDHKTDK